MGDLRMMVTEWMITNEQALAMLGYVAPPVRVIPTRTESGTTTSTTGPLTETWTLTLPSDQTWNIRDGPSLSNSTVLSRQRNGDTVNVIDSQAGGDKKWLQLADGAGFCLRKNENGEWIKNSPEISVDTVLKDLSKLSDLQFQALS